MKSKLDDDIMEKEYFVIRKDYHKLYSKYGVKMERKYFVLEKVSTPNCEFTGE